MSLKGLAQFFLKLSHLILHRGYVLCFVEAHKKPEFCFKNSLEMHPLLPKWFAPELLVHMLFQIHKTFTSLLAFTQVHVPKYIHSTSFPWKLQNRNFLLSLASLTLAFTCFDFLQSAEGVLLHLPMVLSSQIWYLCVLYISSFAPRFNEFCFPLNRPPQEEGTRLALERVSLPNGRFMVGIYPPP